MIHSNYGYELGKRLFDIVVSSLILLLISPLLLLVMLALKIETPNAPVFYTSKRIGRHYKQFDFFKFRSMRPNTDNLLRQMGHLNQYTETNQNAVNEPVIAPDATLLFSDEGWVSEEEVLQSAAKKAEKPFVKIVNDPRITRVGQFIRNTSIDELPQLLNVLRGDMSLVGNRPLPPYEAELLVTDETIARFEAPAGITGLWQVTDRGKKGVSADSRKRLDVEYASKRTFLLDLWILLRTPMAALQHENV